MSRQDTTTSVPLPFKGDVIDFLNINGRALQFLWRDRLA